MDPSNHTDRIIRRHDRAVHIRDFGGDGPLLLLWHGGGCDVTCWEPVITHLQSFHTVAQDLPAHGRSELTRFTNANTVADADAVLADLALGEPILVGHSMGGWAALHYAATHPCRGLVCFDGPISLDYAALVLPADQLGVAPGPPDVAAALQALTCPTMVVLCSETVPELTQVGYSQAEAERFLTLRLELADHLAEHHPNIHVEWLPTSHMVMYNMPKETASLIATFAARLPGA